MLCLSGFKLYSRRVPLLFKYLVSSVLIINATTANLKVVWVTCA